VLHNPEMAPLFCADTRETFQQGAAGVTYDACLEGRDTPTWGERWDFGAGRGRRVTLWQGDADVFVPIELGRMVHGRLPGSRMNVLEGQGHFWLMQPANFERVLRDLMDRVHGRDNSCE